MEMQQSLLNLPCPPWRRDTQGPLLMNKASTVVTVSLTNYVNVKCSLDYRCQLSRIRDEH